jgi:hypothetical protein
MDKIKQHRKAVLEALEDYKSQFRLSSYDLQPHILADEQQHHYQFLWMGWKGERQIFNVSIHIELRDGKIWIQKDNTETGIANLLVGKDIAKSDIVLAYFSPAHRKLTEFAIG